MAEIVRKRQSRSIPSLLPRATWLLFFLAGAEASAADLIARWPLSKDARESQGRLDATVHGGVTFATVEGREAADFDGRNGYLEVADSSALALGRDNFSMALWVHPRRPLEGIPGDLINQWDARGRRGVNLYLSGGSSAYSSISDTRHVHFGIDDAYLGPQRDHGKPCESNSLIANLIVFQRHLYAGIADAADPRDSARVFRLVEGTTWEDCGQIGGGDPTISTVMSMVVHEGRLYAGTGRWDWVIAKGNFPDNPPPRSTRVYVYEGGKTWRDLGEVGKGSRVLCLASYKGTLFAGIDKVGGGHLYRLDGESWIDCGSPDGRNLESLMPWDGALYLATHGNFYRYDGDEKFSQVGIEPHAITQIHALHVAAGRLVAGTWPQGYVLRYAGGECWDITGRLGLPPSERTPINEINGLIHHNGKLYAGVIPLSELYRFEEDGRWDRLSQLGRRSDFAEGNYETWTRLTALASFQGRLFAGTGSCRGRAADCDPEGTLGRVTSFGCGQMASFEDDLPSGWVHLAAVRRDGVLELYVNGKLSARSLDLPDRALDLSTKSPLRMGFGELTYFCGALSDVRVYRGALSEREVVALARSGYRIESIAGNGEAGDTSVAGAPGTSVPVDLPFGVEHGPDGALYITTVGSHRVLRLDRQTGAITSVAGNGKPGYAGDGGPATEATLNEPYEVRFDSKGNMLILEMQNHLIRRVDAKTGAISTLAGDGVAGDRGDGGPARAARFQHPHSITLDQHDNLYVSDLSNHRVRRIDAATGRIDTLAGNGTRGLPQDGGLAKEQPLTNPQGLVVHGEYLWIASVGANVVWRLDLAHGTIQRAAGTGSQGYSGDGGDALLATFDGPRGVAMSPEGILYVVEGENNVLRAFDTVRGTISTIAGAGPDRHAYAGDGVAAVGAPLWQPHGICMSPDGSLIISDTRNHRVRRLVPD